jgi:hypothetical protein
MPLFVVETIQTFRHKYVVDCHTVEHALDTIAMNEADEFSQMSLGEQIIRGYEITHDQFDKMNNDMVEGCGDGTLYQPESGSPWMGQKMIHKVVY